MQIERARSVLLCLRYGIGDVVMETPLLEALRRMAPAARITALGAAPATELLERDPRLDRIVSVDRWGLTHRWDAGDAATRAAIGEWAERANFDLLLDVHHAPLGVRDAILARGLPSLEADERAEAAAVAGGADAVGAMKQAVRIGWGLDVPESLRPRLHLDAEDRAVARAFVRGHTGAGGSDPPAAPVGLSPVASLVMKRWPVDRFARVADRIIAETGRRVLLFCGPNAEVEAALLGALRRPDRVVSVGALHLRRVAALLARCGVFIGNDTGLLHTAAAVGTPTVGIFGPSVPTIFRPPVANATAVGGRGIECPHRPADSLHPPGCWNSSHCLIADRSCVHAVQVPEVLAAVRGALATPGTSPGILRASA